MIDNLFSLPPSRYSEKTKRLAISLRRKGLSYSEIRAQIPVAKSTLSLWLRNVGLSTRQVQKITEKRIISSWKGGQIRHKEAVNRRANIYTHASNETRVLTQRDVWLLCVALYWAEGGKEKIHRPGSGVDFGNTDPRMLRIFIYWLRIIQKIQINRINYQLYIHENSKSRIHEVQSFWAKELNLSLSKLSVVRYKKHIIKTNYANTGNLYNGLIRVKVSSSSALVRQLEGWTQGIDRYIKSL